MRHAARAASQIQTQPVLAFARGADIVSMLLGVDRTGWVVELEEEAESAGTLLVRIAEAQDRAAFTTLYARFAPKVKAYAFKRGADNAAADELAQDVMFIVWRRADQYDPARAAVSTWIYTIARNRWIDLMRHEQLPAPDPNDPAFQPDPYQSADMALARAEDGERLRSAIDALPPDQARLVRTCYFGEKSHRTIAEETGLPLGTVKSRIRLALARLTNALNEEGSA